MKVTRIERIDNSRTPEVKYYLRIWKIKIRLPFDLGFHLFYEGKKKMKGDLIYTKENIKVVIKRRYAYCYLFGLFIGKVEVSEKLFSYLKLADFKKAKESFEVKLAKAIGYKEPK